MRRKQFRILPGILAAALALSLCACGASQTTSSSANSQKEAETATAAETPATEASAEADAAESSEADEITLTSGEEYTVSDTDIFQTYATSVDSFTDVELPFYFVTGDPAGTIQVHYLNDINDIPYISIDEFAEIMTILFTRDTEDTDVISIKDSTDTADEDQSISENTEESEISETAGTEVIATESMDSTEVETVTEDSAEDTFGIECGPIEDEGAKAYMLLRENGSEMIVDFLSNIITFTDIDAFTAFPGAVNGLDRVGLNKIGDNVILKHSSSFYRNPGSLTVDLNYYGIYPVLQDGVGYLPLQTFNDLVFDRIGARLYYNGEAVILATTMYDPAGTEEDNTADWVYYSVEEKDISEELAVFNYNELCMALDYSYGLQDEHKISSFNNLFITSGLYSQLQSTSTDDTFKALFNLCYGFFADMHSSANSRSCYGSTDVYTEVGEDAAEGLVYSNLTFLQLTGSANDEARDEKYPDGVPGYEEVGDTAYVTFDTFQMDSERDYYNTEITNNPDDTIELIIYANEQIHREGSPVKNVVLDLSNNGGGEFDTAVAVISWMLGYATIPMEDVISGAQASDSYVFDANLNGITTGDKEDDSVMDYNLFCLISPTSFSCGNLVPSILKASGEVTILGTASNGGACVVEEMNTADGTIFQISGPYRLNTLSNGTFNSVDQGVEPDFVLSNNEHFYDREYLTNYIDNLP